MTTQIDYNKLLKNIAKERLKPHGIIQYGKSRTFLLDKTWYVIIIEFQPSSFSKGTYLNIDIDFNFYPRDYFAYTLGNRESKFEEFESEEQFTRVINELCDITIKRVSKLDSKFIDFSSTLKTLKNAKGDKIWDLYEKGILNIFMGNHEKALKQLRKVSRVKCEFDWEVSRKSVTGELINWLNEKPTNLDRMIEIINKTRQLKKLPNLTFERIAESINVSKNNLNKSQHSWWKKLFCCV